MSESDQQFITALEAAQIPISGFKHRDHLRAAWCYVTRDGLAGAIRSMERTVRRLSAHHGHEDKYHVTLTIAWLKLVAYHIECHRLPSFDRFIAINGELIETDLPLRFYSRERIFSELAKSTWIEPDLRSLPESC